MFHRRRYTGHHKEPKLLSPHQSLHLVCVMMLFWTLSEGIVSFIVPLKMGEAGFSDTELGAILGASSIAGAAFDFIACRIFKDTYYKRIFGAMFALCFAFALIMLEARTALVFLMGMAVWGVYYDLKNIGDFDYVARTTDQIDSSHSFGLIQVFQSVGWVAGPIIVGFLVGDTVGVAPFEAIFIFLTLALVCFTWLCFSTGSRESESHKRKEKVCRRGTWSEVRLMGRVRKALFPALIVTFVLNFVDAFFWTMGPLYAEFLNLGSYAGFLLTAWSLPGLLLGWHASKVAKKLGKERTAYIMLFIGSLCLIPLFGVIDGSAVIALVFIASFFISFAWPAIQGAFAEYISDREDLTKEIEGLEDFYTNLGYVFGPLLAGIMADMLGYSGTFGFLGVIGASIALLLVLAYPKRINIIKNGPPLICDI